MKKSKVIIPALGVLILSTAASVTGTVAWFTANRTTHIEAGSFTVVKTSSNLALTLGSGVGTTADSTAGTVTVNNKLTDGSVEHRSTTGENALSPTIYTPSEKGTELASTNGSVAVASASTTNMKRGVDSSSNDIYTAVTYTMSFEITFGASNKNIGLFLDCTANHSRFEVTGPASTMATPSTAKGFRMAFIPTSADGVARVFADLQSSGNCKHLDGSITSGWAAGNNYGGVAYSGDLIDSGHSTALPTSGNLSSYTSRVDYLGTFEFADADPSTHKVSLNYTVVCWFEGTDPEIINRNSDADYQTVASYLHFEAIDLPNA